MRAGFCFITTIIALSAVAQKQPTAIVADRFTAKESSESLSFSFLEVPGSEPCAVYKRCLDEVTFFTTTAAFANALSSIDEKLLTQPRNEHAICFGRDTNENIITSAISTGGPSSGRVPSITRAFADLHNHPRNTPPSSGDLYGLLRNNKRQAAYALRFVCIPGGDLYAFVVVDTFAARNFLATYPPQQVPGYSPLFPDALLNESREAKYLHGATEEMAMAYMLEKYKTGVLLLKRTAGGSFHSVHGTDSGTGQQLLYTKRDCLH